MAAGRMEFGNGYQNSSWEAFARDKWNTIENLNKYHITRHILLIYT
jgi:hypothetical protein